MSRNNYECKYIWGSRELEKQLKKQQELLKKKRGFHLEISALTHQLANDLKEGKLIFDPKLMRFRKRNIVNIGSVMIKVKKTKRKP